MNVHVFREAVAGAAAPIRAARSVPKKRWEQADDHEDVEADWSIEAVGKRLKAAGRSATLAQLSSLFHQARMAFDSHGDRFTVQARLDNALHQARSLYPDQPEGVRPIGLPVQRGATNFPDHTWPEWRRRLYEHWEEQCAAIDRGLGVPEARSAVALQFEMMKSIGERMLDLPASTVEEASAKLSAIAHLRELDLDPESASTIRLHKLAGELRGLSKA